MKLKKDRIDRIMVLQGICESRNIAQRLVMAGEVSVDGQLVYKPSDQYPEDCAIILANQPKYVSRGGLKLEKALAVFEEVEVEGKVCADVGASTGGFTDCLLQNGARVVYAIDVGYGQLHQSIREHKDVIVMERVNIKKVDTLPEEIDLVAIDVSFISLSRVFPIIKNWNKEKLMRVIALIKPQFEVGKKVAAAGKGVIHHEKDRQKAIDAVIDSAEHDGFINLGIIESPIQGPKGNIEYLLYLAYNPKELEGG
jgi:23S rRNA (cytidine1920-2'-O)/16S rRNA (cytidine1409-2'-O)-methyltransferase